MNNNTSSTTKLNKTSRVKKVKGWAAVGISDKGGIRHSHTLPMIYIQRTKPTIYDGEGRKGRVVSCTITY